MLNKEHIVRTLQENSKTLRDQFSIEKMGLFGSFSRGQETPQSDIDFIIELNPNTEDIYETKQALRKYLKRIFHRKIELAHYKYLKSYARDQILSGVVPIV